jgi:hypothetical protein
MTAPRWLKHWGLWVLGSDLWLQSLVAARFALSARILQGIERPHTCAEIAASNPTEPSTAAAAAVWPGRAPEAFWRAEGHRSAVAAHPASPAPGGA